MALSNTAPWTVTYLPEVMKAYERVGANLEQTCTRAINVESKTAYFLKHGDGGASAVTRGNNGKIPVEGIQNEQISVVLEECHAIKEATKFVLDFSQGPQRQLMVEDVARIIGRKMTDQITTILATASTNADAVASIASVDGLEKARATLAAANVPTLEGDNMFFLVTPQYMRFAYQWPEFASKDYAGMMIGGQKVFKYRNLNFIEMNGLPGAGTSSASCFMYHRSAIGHAMTPFDGVAGYDDKQALYFARASVNAQAVLLDGAGVYKILHNDTAA